jgi:hypothetical protein
LGGPISANNSTTGNLDITALSTILLLFYVPTTASLITHGDIKMDDWFYCDSAPVTSVTTTWDIWRTCDVSPATWYTSPDAIAMTLDESVADVQEGNACFNLGKGGTAGTGIIYYYSGGPQSSFVGKSAWVWVYIKDVTKLASVGTACTIRIENSTSGVGLLKTHTQAQLVNGWQKLGGPITGWAGVFDANMNMTRIYFYTPLAGDTIPLGDLKMDYWHLTSPGVTTFGAGNNLLYIPGYDVDKLVRIRGGASKDIDIYDISSNVWSLLSYTPASETFTTGTMATAFTDSDRVYILIGTADVGGSQRIFELDLTNNTMTPYATQNILANSTLNVKKSLAGTKLTDKV